MVSAVLLVAAAGVVYSAITIATGLRANIARARKTGLPYIVIPCASSNVVWRLAWWIGMPMIRCLPKRLWKDWLFYMRPDWAYKDGQEPWDRLGDTFLAVSPGLIALDTQSPNAIHQITSRREHFPKATQHYKILEIFGRNILTTEGAVWRFHRKATSASFNEKNAAHTFAEAIHQTQGLLAKWVATAQSDAPTITTIEKDTMALALHIIGYVGFGIRLSWPGEPLLQDVDPRLRKYGSHTPPPGHTMTFSASVEAVLHNILLLLILPRWLMRVLSHFMKTPRAALEASQNYAQYMAEFLADKAAAAQEGTHSDGMDLMGQLVRGRYENERAAKATKSKSGELALTDDEIIGNAFIMLVAGHETTANALHFTFIELANNPASQRALQADIDRLLGRDTDPAMWNFETSVNLMLASMMGAAINETLRLIPPVVMIPKQVTPLADQPLALADTGETHVLPAGTDVSLQVVSAHRNAKYWPSAKGETETVADTDDFLPERWYRSSGASSETEAEVDGADTEDYGGFKGPDTSANMFRPVRGAFTPFSDGPRSCLGRRIAQVEMMAALAVVFQRYSIELAVDDWADDAAVAGMSDDERRAVYAQAQAKSRAVLRTATTLLTLKLHDTKSVKVRLVPRGEERFVGIV